MTANADALMDEAISLGLVLDQLAQDSFGRVRDKLARLSEDLASLVVRIDPTAVVRDAARRDRLEKLVDEANIVIAAAYGDIRKGVNQDLDDTAELTQDSLSKVLALLLLIRGLSRQLDKPARTEARQDVVIEGAAVDEWWGRQKQDMQFRTARTLNDAMMLTQLGKEPGTGDLVNAIRGTGPGSLFSAPPRYAYGLLLGAFHAVANRIRYEIVLRHNELFRAFQHISVLDQRTSPPCRARANRLWTLQGAPIGHTLPFMRPPLHWRCRSHLVAVMHPYSDLPPRIQRRIRKEDFDGNPSSEPDMTEWLSTRGTERDAGPLDYQGARRKLGL